MTRMSTAERQAFLADVHVGVLSIPREGAAPLSSPVWYDYQPGGDLTFLTMAASRKGRLLKAGQPVSFCVQNETPPYAYVSVSGTVSRVEPSRLEEELRPLARRYLGVAGGDAYTDSEGVEGTITVHVALHEWLTYGGTAGS
jgi:nitroimidazol reductase NimA-like FMN-containing flavoprotein (pyridoxamine 5'-phosphate oxidase superfamily)